MSKLDLHKKICKIKPGKVFGVTFHTVQPKMGQNHNSTIKKK